MIRNERPPTNNRRRLYNKGNLLWHADVSFDANRAAYSLLAAHRVPPGGAPTEFADMRRTTILERAVARGDAGWPYRSLPRTWAIVRARVCAL